MHRYIAEIGDLIYCNSISNATNVLNYYFSPNAYFSVGASGVFSQGDHFNWSQLILMEPSGNVTSFDIDNLIFNSSDAIVFH